MAVIFLQGRCFPFAQLIEFPSWKVIWSPRGINAAGDVLLTVQPSSKPPNLNPTKALIQSPLRLPLQFPTKMSSNIPDLMERAFKHLTLTQWERAWVDSKIRTMRWTEVVIRWVWNVVYICKSLIYSPNSIPVKAHTHTHTHRKRGFRLTSVYANNLVPSSFLYIRHRHRRRHYHLLRLRQ